VKSGALSPLKHFARRGPLGRERLIFMPLTTDTLERAVQNPGLFSSQ
jgi:hypothetical protein